MRVKQPSLQPEPAARIIRGNLEKPAQLLEGALIVVGSEQRLCHIQKRAVRAWIIEESVAGGGHRLAVPSLGGQGHIAVIAERHFGGAVEA